MKKTLMSLALVAAAVASNSAVAAFIPFTVNETVVSGAIANSFTAGKVSGDYTELIGLTSATSFSASAIGFFHAYGDVNGSSNGFPQQLTASAGLTPNTYSMYALFTATGSTTNGTTFTGTGGQVQIWLDPSQDTTFNPITSYTAMATKSGGTGDDIMIGSSSTSFGTGDLGGPPGAFNIYFKDFTLSAFGATYWTGINTLNFLLQTNGDIDAVTPTGSTPLPAMISGDFSANFATIPEPASIGLVGLALVGVGLAGQRRRSRKS